MRDRLWRIRRTPQRFHYLDWCEKIKEKYSSRGEYGFAGATLTFLQGEKESEQKKSGEERRLMLFFQNLIFCWQNSIGVKISIGNERVLEQSVRTALEISMRDLSVEEEKRFSREVKIAKDLLDGKEKTEAEMRKSQVFCRWQDGFSWEEISGIREIREYTNSLEKTLEIRREIARLRSTSLVKYSKEPQRSAAERPESRMVHLEQGERKNESRTELQETAEVIKNIDRIREETAIQREKLTETEKKLQTERAETETRILERERQIEKELRLEKKRQAERELRSEKERQAARELRLEEQKQIESGLRLEKQRQEEREVLFEKKKLEEKLLLSEAQDQKTERQQLEKQLTERQVLSERQKLTEREMSLESRRLTEREVPPEDRKLTERQVQSESQKLLEREVPPEDRKLTERELRSEKERQIESEIYLQEQKEGPIRREEWLQTYSKNADESAETDIQAEPAGNEQLEMPESRLVYLTQTEKQEETPGAGTSKTKETILQVSSWVREEKRELEEKTRQFESEKKQLEEKLYKTEKILRTEQQKEIENIQRAGRQLEQQQTEQLLTLQQKQDTGKQQETEKRQQVKKLLEIERQQQIDHRSFPQKTYQLERVLETEKFQQEAEKERQEKKKLESEFVQQTGKKSELELLQQLGKNSELQSEIDREIQWEKQLGLEQAPLPEMPEAQLIYRNQENQSGSSPVDRSSDPGQLLSTRDRLEQFLPVTAAGKSALLEQKIINERTNVILKSLLSEKIWKNAESAAVDIVGKAERGAAGERKDDPYGNEVIRLTDRIQPRQTSSASRRAEFQPWQADSGFRQPPEFQSSARRPDTIINLLTSINRPENKTKLQILMSSQENQTKFRTVMRDRVSQTKLRTVMRNRESQTVMNNLENQTKRRTAMDDLGNAEKARNFTDYPESITRFHTLMSHPENAAKFQIVTDQAENTTRFRTIMSRLESTAGPQSAVNPMSSASPISSAVIRISEAGGHPPNSGYSEILPGITRFRTRRGVPGTITEIRMISGIRPAVQILDPAGIPQNMDGSEPGMIHISDLAGTAKIQYADHGKRRQEQTASSSEVSAMSAKLMQTREETRILRRDSGYARSTIIEQEKKINGLRQELHEQMKTVNEEVKRLANTQKQDASVRNMADRVMKELQKQFRTEKIRRGY